MDYKLESEPTFNAISVMEKIMLWKRNKKSEPHQEHLISQFSVSCVLAFAFYA